MPAKRPIDRQPGQGKGVERKRKAIALYAGAPLLYAFSSYVNHVRNLGSSAGILSEFGRESSKDCCTFVSLLFARRAMARTACHPRLLRRRGNSSPLLGVGGRSRSMCSHPRLSVSPVLTKRTLISLVLRWLIVSGCATPETWPRQERGRGARDIAFVGNEACAECHQQQFEEWKGSHHDWSMRHADSASVLGDFNSTKFEHFGVTSRFFTRGGLRGAR
jgi:hypothetical protein